MKRGMIENTTGRMMAKIRGIATAGPQAALF
jgi:hypothetical protein